MRSFSETLPAGQQAYCRSYYHCKSADTRIQAHQGGSRSGKTWSILQYLIESALPPLSTSISPLPSSSPFIVTICRKTFPALRATVMRDFFELLMSLDAYERKNHNKTEHTYLLHNTLFEFIGLDEPQKVRGRKRTILFMNEANEFTFEDFTQLSLRTTHRIFMDYNPSAPYHWIYEQVLTRDDCTFFQTTYRDNLFLNKETILEIERLQETDDNLWRVFGLGERGISRAHIFSKWQEIESLPEKGQVVYGLDFGYTSPTALVQVVIFENDLFIHELIYEPRLNTSALIEAMKRLIANRRLPIYADTSEPDKIEDIYRAGFNIHPALKNVMGGIDRLRRCRLFITSSSFNLLKEMQSYKYDQDKNGILLENPFKENDHAIDALRYAAHSHFKKPSGKYAIR